MDKEKFKSVYIWIFIFVLLVVVIIAVGFWTAQRDAQRETERKYEFNIIQSIIENLAIYQEEIESWGYQVSVLTLTEEPDNEALQRYYRNHCSHPILILTDTDGGMYCFYYGFDEYTSVVSYPAEVKRTSGEYTNAIKTVSLELFKREMYQAPYLENPNDADKGSYYDVQVEINVEAFSVGEGKEIWASHESGYYYTNYCSNNFADNMRFNGIDPVGDSRNADLQIKREYSAEQLLAFYRQGLDLQERLIELYQQTVTR